MLMELQMDTRAWTTLLPVIQANMNHTPVRSPGGLLPLGSLWGSTIVTSGKSRAASKWPPPRELTTEKLHQGASDRKELRRLQELAKQKDELCNFEPCDSVLWFRIDKRLRGNKLLVQWVGPFRVLRVFPHSSIVKHLATGDEYDVHESRLKFYSDSDLNVTAEIRQHVGSQCVVLDVRGILQHRFNDSTQVWELFVSQRGLQDE
ncbi:hypothetical protein PHMEG_0008934 [Phytophthora megakarya]|uniref:Chromo domain-containing protein n=1 Tax=Phytophthora megakarya TaxID=4795 RepID=A0A225WJH6_9STRA|nr:hypothetical protein PHMEG_0008934 [Phytophthora megakarya]